MYSQTVLDEIRDRVSIAALVGERVALKKAGRNFKGLCPFHSEKSPSFMVSDEKRIYHCFGCGEGGNVFSFFMKYDNLSFLEAVEMLAERAGINLPKQTVVNKEKEDETERKKKWAYRINELAMEYFCRNMADPQKGADACNYLKSRGFTQEAIDSSEAGSGLFEKSEFFTQHFLGYAEDSWDGLVSFLKEKNAPLELAAELGLLKRRESGSGYYDFFRHRVMFPVILPGYAKKGSTSGVGRIVAFSGRTFGNPKTAEGREAPAKYLNSPDSVIYHKSYTVYGLNVAAEAIRQKDQAVLVEGNLDVFRLHQMGMKNVTAPLGTALTSGHIKQLSRYTKNFVVMFDGDPAGRGAAVRSLPLFLEEGLVPKAVILPDGSDPDSFAQQNGVEKLGGLISAAPTLFEWVIDHTVEKFGNDTNGKVMAVEELKPLFGMIINGVETAVYRKRLAGRLLLDESVLATAFMPRRGKDKEAVTADVKRNRPEKMALELMLSYPETVKDLRGAIRIEQFSDGAYATIAKMIFEAFDNAGSVDVEKLIDMISEAELKNEVMTLSLSDNKYEDVEKAKADCVGSLKKLAAKARLDELMNELKKLNANDERLPKYMAEIQNITKELHNLGT